ncbi:MAG: hypothetical protein AB1503_12650, partial [Bacillota bacterium]
MRDAMKTDHLALDFTGSTPFTSRSRVRREMRSPSKREQDGLTGGGETMRTFPILQVDAFTQTAFCGNPAAIV